MAALATPPPAAPPAPVAAPVNTPAPASIQESLKADFAAQTATATTPEVAPIPDTPADVAPVVDPTANPETPVVDPGTDTTTEAQPDTTIEDAPVDAFSEIEPDSVSQDGKRHFYNPTKSKRLQEDHKLVQQLAEIIPDFSVDAVKQLAVRANQADELMSMFRTGPENVEAMDNVLGTYHQADPVAFGVMAIRALAHLPQANPQAAQQVDRIYTDRVLNQARARIAQVPQDQREAEANFVQNLELRYTGQYTPKERLLAGANPDPAASEREWIQQQKAQIEQFHQTQAQQQRAARFNSINTAENSAVVGAINEVLTPLKGNSAFNESDLEAMQNDFEKAIIQAEGANELWQGKYKILRMEAERSGDPQAVEQLAQFRRTIAKQVVQQNSRRIIAARGQSVQAANQAQHQQAAQAPRTELSPNGVTAPAPNGAVDQMLKAGTWDDMFKAAGWKR
jgi:hypothetical protein